MSPASADSTIERQKARLDLSAYYQPRPVQAKFHASRAIYPLMEGGRGGGKSMALLWEAIMCCLYVPGCNCLLLRRTLTAVEKGGIEDHFTKYVPRSLYLRYNSSKHIVTFRNGSKLFFGHIKCDRDLLQYQGAEFFFIGWEELTQFTYRMWDFIKGSNRCPVKVDYKGRPVYARMGAGTNPNGKGAQWVKALWITKKPPAGEMSVNYDPAEYEAIHSTYLDNPTYASDREYIRKLQGISDPYLRAAWIPGDWGALSGQFFTNWEAEWSEKKRRWVGRHVRNIKEVKFLPWEERWISIRRRDRREERHRRNAGQNHGRLSVA